jgi:hypothetical protein
MIDENKIYLRRLREAMDCHMSDDFLSAKNIYSEIIKARPDFPQVLGNLAAILEDEGRDLEALDLLKRASRLSPDDQIMLSNIQKMHQKTFGFQEERNDNEVEDVVVDLTLCGKRNGPNVHGGGIYGYRLAEAIIARARGCRVHLLVDAEFNRQVQANVFIYSNWTQAPNIPEALDHPSTLVIYPLPYKYFRHKRFGLKAARCMPAILGMRSWELLRQNEFRVAMLGGGSSSRFDGLINADLSNFEACLTSLEPGDGVICLTQFVSDSLRFRFSDLSFATYILPPLIFSDRLSCAYESRNIGQPYRFLFLGPERQEKNYELLRGASKFFQKTDQFEIHLLTDAPTKFSSLPNSNLVVHETPISEADKEKLINYVDCLIYPSLSEGFGMPPMEFCKQGKESIVSAIQPHLSIYSTVSHFVNPSDPFDLYRQMKLVAKIKPSLARSRALKEFFEKYCVEADRSYDSFVASLIDNQQARKCQGL